jgi:hypothetical protein
MEEIFKMQKKVCWKVALWATIPNDQGIATPFAMLVTRDVIAHPRLIKALKENKYTADYVNRLCSRDLRSHPPTVKSVLRRNALCIEDVEQTHAFALYAILHDNVGNVFSRLHPNLQNDPKLQDAEQIATRKRQREDANAEAFD